MEKIENLRFITTKMQLPTLVDNKTDGALIYFANTTIDSIARVVNGSQHPKIQNVGRKYKVYYYDSSILRNCIKSPKIRSVSLIKPKVARMDRMAQYQLFRTGIEGTVRTPLNLNVTNGLNAVYDLNPVLNMFINNEKVAKLSVVDKCKAFFETFISAISQDVTYNDTIPYKKLAIFINMDDVKYYKDKEYGHLIYQIIFILTKKPKLIELINRIKLDIVPYTENGYFVISPSELKVGDKSKINMLLKKLKADVDFEDVANNSVKLEISSQLVKKFNLTGPTQELISLDSDIVNTLSDNIEDPEEIQSLGEEELTKMAPDFKEQLYDAVNVKSSANMNPISKRDEELREKQKKLKLDNKTIEEILKAEVIIPVKETQVEVESITNPNMKSIKFTNFQKTYMEENYQSDVMQAFMSLNNQQIPMSIISIDKENTSDPLNLKETYTVEFEDVRRKRHKVKVDLPLFIDDRFMYINGNKKVINKQFFAKPVIKTGQDEVQVCTNYNKIFIRRMGTKFSPNMEKFKKMCNEPKKYGFVVEKGNNSQLNRNYITNLEFDELSSMFNRITIGDSVFIFNCDQLKAELGDPFVNSIDKLTLGYTKYEYKGKTDKIPIIFDMKSGLDTDIVNIIISRAPDSIKDEFKTLSSGKKYFHTKATIMAKNIPVIILLAYFEGLSTVIRKFSDKSVSYTDKKEDKSTYQYIKFADGYLSYPLSNMEACILFNGLTEINTASYTFADMDDTNTYLSIFETLFGSSYIAGALTNYYYSMIDPKTLQVLKLLNYPEDLVSLLIYANNLLADNVYSDDIDLNLYRLRDNEIIPAMLYKQLSIAYAKYRATANNPNPVKITMDQGCVIKELMALPTVEDYSTLNPIIEVTKNHLASMKGYVGMNLDRAYTQQKRSYHDSMLGIVGISTDNGPNVGKVRHLTLEPKITNTLGFIETYTDTKDLHDVNLFTPAELSTPLSARRDSPERTAMTTKQSGHIIPVQNNCPVLITTGMDQIIHNYTSNDFSVVAQEDGVVEDINEKVGIVIIKYKSGKIQAIDISSRMVKNGGGGFYLINRLQCDLSVGDKFKKDQVIAYDYKFYKNQNQLGNRMGMGALSKVAIMSNYATFEDGTFITKKLSKDMSSEISMSKSVSLGKNANVDFIVKRGDKIKSGENFITFENSYDDSSLNDLLSNIRDDLAERIINNGKTNITSHYTGVISDVVIYCTVDLDELSPTLRNIVSSYQKEQKSRRQYLDKWDTDKTNSVYKMGILLDKPDDKVETSYGKVKGQQVDDGVLIEFYVTYHDEMAIGDKMAQFTANKCTVGYVVPEGFEPYTEFRPYEEISCPVAPSAIIQRGTTSVVTTIALNKALVELKRKCYEILTGENYNEVLKRQKEEYEKSITESMEAIDEYAIEELHNILSFCDIELVDDTKLVATRQFIKGDVIMPIKDLELIKLLTRHEGYVNCYIDTNLKLLIADDNINICEVLISN